MENGKKPERYACLRCGYVYDPRRGDPEGGLPPGTDLAQAPKDWRCARCGADQKDFALKDE